MAIVLDSFRLTYELEGTNFSSRSKTFEIEASGADDAAKVANAHLEAAAFTPLFAAVTDAYIVGYNLTGIFREQVPPTPPLTARLYDEAFLTLGLVASNKKANIAIPSPHANIFIGDDKNAATNIDTADAALQAFLDEFKAAGKMRVSDGESIDAINPLGSRLRSVRSGKSY